MIKPVFKTLKLLNNRNRRFFYILIPILLINMIFEMVTLGAVVPLISTLMNQDYVFFKEIEILNTFNFLDISMEIYLILFFIIIFIFKSLIVMGCKWLILKFDFSIRKYLSSKLFARYISMPFFFYFKNNSSILVKNIHEEIQLAGKCLNEFLNFLTELFVIIGILIILILYNFKITIILTLSSLIIFLIVFYSLKKKLNFLGKNSQILETKRVKNYFENFSSIKEIKIFNKEQFFIKKTSVLDNNFFDTNFYSMFLMAVPRVAIELVAVITIFSIFIYLLTNNTSLASAVPTILIFVAAAYRILPSLNRIINSINVMGFLNPVVENLNGEFSRTIYEEKNLNGKNIKTIKKSINLKNISYKYDDKKILDKVNFDLFPGDFIGITGKTGAGKSTLINIISGLLNNYSGEFFVDGENIKNINSTSYKKLVGYVSQKLYFLDDTIEKNIGFGEKHIDRNKVWRALELVKLKEFCENLEKNIDTIIGENALKLSGGQAQRLGLARIFYFNPEIIIFDESTNSLDETTEDQILKIINKIHSNKIKIMITHRTNPLKFCNKVFQIDNSKIKKI